MRPMSVRYLQAAFLSRVSGSCPLHCSKSAPPWYLRPRDPHSLWHAVHKVPANWCAAGIGVWSAQCLSTETGSSSRDTRPCRSLVSWRKNTGGSLSTRRATIHPLNPPIPPLAPLPLPLCMYFMYRPAGRRETPSVNSTRRPKLKPRWCGTPQNRDGVPVLTALALPCAARYRSVAWSWCTSARVPASTSSPPATSLNPRRPLPLLLPLGRRWSLPTPNLALSLGHPFFLHQEGRRSLAFPNTHFRFFTCAFVFAPTRPSSVDLCRLGS